MIVEDKVDIAQSLEDLLSLLGQETHIAYNGLEALKVAKDFKPELVFLDIGLPGMTGYEVARQLRAQDNTPTPRLIAVTGWGGEQDVSLARAAGFDQHLTKPVDPREVEKILRTL
jgi:CheY-like chemotaxis protein